MEVEERPLPTARRPCHQSYFWSDSEPADLEAKQVLVVQPQGLAVLGQAALAALEPAWPQHRTAKLPPTISALVLYGHYLSQPSWALARPLQILTLGMTSTTAQGLQTRQTNWLRRYPREL